jgi:hypothetical protein
MARVKSAAVLVVLVLLAAACGNDDEEPTTAVQTGSEADAELSEMIGFGEALAQVRGHHRAALELYSGGDERGAMTHAGHPIEEILDSVSSGLEEHNGDVEGLRSALESVASTVESGGSEEELSSAIDDAGSATEQALTDVVGDTAEQSDFKGSVIAALLATAAHEYEEAVGESGIRNLPEYQDGYAFTQEARDLYGEISSDVESASEEEAGEIEEAFESLTGAFPSVQPPEELAAVEDVEESAELIGHELEETVDAQLLEEADHEDVVAEIESLLADIEKAYAQGDNEQAAELSAEAYLENYEVIEADVIEQAPNVNEELEPLLGAELRKQIDEDAPKEEIETMIDRARRLLRQALEALETAA